MIRFSDEQEKSRRVSGVEVQAFKLSGESMDPIEGIAAVRGGVRAIGAVLWRTGSEKKLALNPKAYQEFALFN